MRFRFSPRLLICGAALLGLGGAALLLDRLFPPDLQRWTDRSTMVLAADGSLLRPFSVEDGRWRLPTTADDVDPLYLSMLIAVEDRRFGWHPGVDPVSVVRAAVQAMVHQRIISGASTLTMQVARLLEPKNRTFRSKLIESTRALQLQARFGSRGILELYLTLAPFGGPLEGVTSASLAWFGKLPKHLTPAEAALLVALPQSPERLRPDRNPEAARQARDKILTRAVERGLLKPDSADAARADPIPTFQRPMPMLAPHLSERLTAGLPTGSIVHSTLSAPLQRRLEDLGRSWLSRLDDGADLAVVVLANQDHRLVAHLGSGDWHQRQLDLSQAVRSPGSTLKPFIYAVAFDDLSLHPGTLIADAPQRFGDWLPRNFDHDYHGQITAREALQRSLNVPAVLALEKVGPARLSALLQLSGANLSFPRNSDPGLPLALGGVGMRLTDLAGLYAGLADDGIMQPIRQTTDNPAPTPSYRLVGEAAARATITILEGSPSPDGIASRRAVDQSRKIAFKTGTSFGFRDAWTVGTSADYTVAVWVGRADGAPRPGALGRNTAAPLMFRVFDLLPPDRSRRKPPEQPDHALYHSQPPSALRVLTPDLTPAAAQTVLTEPLRILFPPDGATVESLTEGISLKAAGGRPPLHWIANGHPLPEDSQFWAADSSGFSRLVVVDADGRRAAVSIRVLRPEDS